MAIFVDCISKNSILGAIAYIVYEVGHSVSSTMVSQELLEFTSANAKVLSTILLIERNKKI